MTLHFFNRTAINSAKDSDFKWGLVKNLIETNGRGTPFVEVFNYIFSVENFILFKVHFLCQYYFENVHEQFLVILQVSVGGLLWGYEDGLPCTKLTLPKECHDQ